MRFQQTHIAGLFEIFPNVFHDQRGFFFETYKQDVFALNGIPFDFVQDNQSFSSKGVLRGLHFQKEPFAQGKLVRVITGKVLDVVVDIRPSSATFGQHMKFILDSKRANMVYVPAGCAHGFAALEDSIFLYKCTAVYKPEAEGGIQWNDPELNIDWDLNRPLVSQKDQLLPLFKEALTLNTF